MIMNKLGRELGGRFALSVVAWAFIHKAAED
jgi:hypothetical protein